MEAHDMVTKERSTIDPPALEELAGLLRGRLISPEDVDYDAARTVRNGLIDRYPGAIVRPSGTTDVVEAVRYASRHNLTLSVRGGGHNVAGTAVNDGGLVIDLSSMRGVYVDPAHRTARAQGGATWGDVDRETQRYGMSVPGGVVSTTGIGGLTLHGGLGHMRRAHGLSIDNLRSVEIVTADGEVLTASERENEDVFWAVRGAGPNFGVITSFEYRMHPMGPLVWLSGTAYDLADAGSVLRGWRDLVASTPDEISPLALQWNIPDVDAFPPEVRDHPVVLVAAVHPGPIDEAERLTKPFRELATPLLDLSHAEQFAHVQASFDPFFPVGRRYYWKSTYVDDMSDEAIDVLVDRGRRRVSGMASVTIWPLGGAIGRVDPQATAYARRDAPYVVAAEATWEDPSTDDANIQWSRETVAALQPFSKGGLYLNFGGFGEDREAMLRATYGPNYDRLVGLKNRYDPDNLFHMNQNIRPTGTA
jgi:FAD/FMN-containing dehydrogenase